MNMCAVNIIAIKIRIQWKFKSTWGPFYYNRLTTIRAWTIKYVHNFVWYVITHPYLIHTFKGGLANQIILFHFHAFTNQSPNPDARLVSFVSNNHNTEQTIRYPNDNIMYFESNMGYFTAHDSNSIHVLWCDVDIMLYI